MWFSISLINWYKIEHSNLFLFFLSVLRINIIKCCALIIPIFIESKSATAGTVKTKRNRSYLGPCTMHQMSTQFTISCVSSIFLWENKRSDVEDGKREKEKKRRKKINWQNTMVNRKFIQIKFLVRINNNREFLTIRHTHQRQGNGCNRKQRFATIYFISR